MANAAFILSSVLCLLVLTIPTDTSEPTYKITEVAEEVNSGWGLGLFAAIVRGIVESTTSFPWGKPKVSISHTQLFILARSHVFEDRQLCEGDC